MVRGARITVSGSEPAIRRRVETIRLESGKAAATITRLLDFARSPRQPVQTLDLWPAIESATSMRQASLGRSRVALTLLRDSMAPAWLNAEPVKVQQTLLNLLLAAEDRVSGQPKARIELSVSVDGAQTMLRLVATSDGASSSPLDADAPPPEATGLTRDAQLWAAAYLARLSQGSLTVDGGTFVVRWPSATP